MRIGQRWAPTCQNHKRHAILYPIETLRASKSCFLPNAQRALVKRRHRYPAHDGREPLPGKFQDGLDKHEPAPLPCKIRADIQGSMSEKYFL